MKIDLNILEQVAISRKMPIDDLIRGFRVENGSVELPEAEALAKLASKLIVPTSVLTGGEPSDTTDLDGGVKIAEPGEGFRITGERGGAPYYTYQHLATTDAAPELMALKLTLHCNSEKGIVLNDGHDAKELIFVLRGDVRMDWVDPEGEQRTARLQQGASVYVDPGLPHSFSSIGETAEVLAINYRT
jgi:mannose-6-phosphate isomerase-like protein (cupin superfamily)